MAAAAAAAASVNLVMRAISCAVGIPNVIEGTYSSHAVCPAGRRFAWKVEQQHGVPTTSKEAERMDIRITFSYLGTACTD